uniref:Uncharacterized protein n=1 Tax=Rhipicephalus zambeziensis TaxID=60191 RepID=A0A224YAE5_9ACAR
MSAVDILHMIYIRMFTGIDPAGYLTREILCQCPVKIVSCMKTVPKVFFFERNVTKTEQRVPKLFLFERIIFGALTLKYVWCIKTACISLLSFSLCTSSISRSSSS